MSEPAASARRGRYAKGTARREEILDSAYRVIAAQGVEAASVTAVAAEVGLSPTGVMHYFSTRLDLLTAVLVERDRRDHEPASESKAFRGLVGLVETVRSSQKTPALILLFTTLSAAAADPEHAAHDFFVRHHRELHGWLVADIERGQADGRFRTDVPAAALARIAAATADGLQLQWLLEPSFELGDVMDTLATVLAASRS